MERRNGGEGPYSSLLREDEEEEEEEEEEEGPLEQISIST